MAWPVRPLYLLMKRIFLGLLLASGTLACAQTNSKLINVAEVRRIESVLASDSMQGRRAGTPGSDKAAAFIAAEFKKAGLQPVANGSYLQSFSVFKPKFLGLEATVNGAAFDSRNVIVVTTQPEVALTQASGYETVTVSAGDDLSGKVMGALQGGKNAVVLIDTSFAKTFPRLQSLKRQLFQGTPNVVFMLTADKPSAYSVKATHSFEETRMANVVGILPGKAKKAEQVIFSGHYDHLGLGKAVNGDSIYNGANDDAAGTTAVIMLANHFKKQNNNERTLVFAAFTAEEVGGFGATYFSRQFDPAKVAAMFNIEMIGTESKWGKNSAYITGFEKTDMGAILQRNLEGTGFTFHPDPYPDQQLFYRSDNATLARLGVPAHTISTSKMDSEKFYHTVDDEVETLDMDNMAAIIEAIAKSSASIISGKDSPSRVKQEDLKR